MKDLVIAILQKNNPGLLYDEAERKAENIMLNYPVYREAIAIWDKEAERILDKGE